MKKVNSETHANQANLQDHRLARFSLCMAIITLVLMLLAVLINILCWVSPNLATQLVGFSFSISMINELQVDLDSMPFWQWLGGIILSTIPLLALLVAAINLYKLFYLYAHNNYFSLQACRYMARVGSGIVIWSLLSLLATPLLSLWLSATATPGNRMLLVSFTSTDAVTLFLGASFWLIARILAKASAVYQENQAFI